ncbi:MAG: GTPase [Gammaproteobacteria bacterium]
MDYDYSDLVARTKTWAEQAAASGWIDQAATRELLDIDIRTPETLVGKSAGRPLIVAFMGGTGVGKSSLLNRLAGQDIARTGIERPTSKEVTLFHHRAIQLQQLPEKLPLEQIRIAYHDDELKKDLIWIDMPDFDSTEQHNKEIVMAWLPYIDLLIYVVSPERYRDNKAWRLLLSEGNRHAWMFVINQWDRGDALQLDDFKSQLSQAGFEDPLIFKTICTEHFEDDFSELRSTVESLANQNTIKQLKARGAQIRIAALREKLENCLSATGTDKDCLNLPHLWQSRWRQTTETLLHGFEWPIKQLASHYASHDNAPTDTQFQIWDDWAQGMFEDELDDIIIQADSKQLPKTPLKMQLQAIRERAGKIMTDQTQFAARQALANPGHALHRFFLRLMLVCEIVLPLAAMGGVSYQLLTGFYSSSVTHQDYLGVDFAIHSILLILISWLVPFFIQKKLKPSLEKSALKGLRRGLVAGMSQIESEVLEALEQFRLQRLTVTARAETIIADCAFSGGAAKSLKGTGGLDRVLID